jgi:23S rRNA (cytidine2498-2'-O)-methyltransferase
MLTGYLAAEGLEQPLEKELVGIKEQIGRLYLAEGPVQTAYFAQNIWHDVQEISFSSISEAAKQLKELGKLWAFYPHLFVRRGQLIAEKLPYFAPKPLSFPSKLPNGPLGSWTMKEENCLYAAAKCSSPFAHGQVHFQETKAPPSRAYLKLWEALTLLQAYPQAGDLCLEMGASPGSWTWALQQIGCHVIAVDRAPLADHVASLERVEFLKKDAFSLKPEDFPHVKWIFSDVICYPEKLLEWVEKWKSSHPLANFVCTIKFQGERGYDIAKEFAKIPGSKVFHLSHNKHELTWALIR